MEEPPKDKKFSAMDSFILCKPRLYIPIKNNLQGNAFIIKGGWKIICHFPEGRWNLIYPIGSRMVLVTFLTKHVWRSNGHETADARSLEASELPQLGNPNLKPLCWGTSTQHKCFIQDSHMIPGFSHTHTGRYSKSKWSPLGPSRPTHSADE